MNVTVTSAAQTNSSRATLFVDEDGQPSEICGPDLKKARSVEEMIASLKGLRTGGNGTYSSAFWRAAKESGIHLATMYWSEELEEQLQMILPCDDQVELREPRYKALKDHLHARPGRRQAVIDLVNMLGHFADNRPYFSVREAAELLLAAGGRIYILPDGRCEEVLPYNEASAAGEGWNAYPLRRLMHRYHATLHRKGAREEMTQLVRAHGEEQAGSIVWERANA